MKRDWEPEELASTFGLTEDEQRWVSGRTDYHQLGLAVLLKYFQLEGRFPVHRTDISLMAVRYLAQQLDVPLEHYPRYIWQGRTFERDRQAVRGRLGFREITVEELDALTLWLEDQPLMSQDQTIAKLKALAYERLHELHLEPPSPDRLDRAVRTALHRFEQRFFQSVWHKLSAEVQEALDSLVIVEALDDEQQAYRRSPIAVLKADPGPLGVKSVLQEITKLQYLQAIVLPSDVFDTLSPKLIAEYAQRAAAEPPRELRQHPPAVRHTLLAAFCWRRRQEVTDNLVELLVQIVHKMNTRAEHRVDRAVLAEVKHVHHKQSHLVKMARASLAAPQGTVEDVIFPVVSQSVLHDIVSEAEASQTYTQQVHHELRSSYSHHYRALLPSILNALQFESSNMLHRPIIRALQLLRKYVQSHQVYYPLDEAIPIQDVVPTPWVDLVVETDAAGQDRVNRINYELSVLHTLRQKLRSKEVWVEGADKYRSPDRDLPADFDVRRDQYYALLELPGDVEAFIQLLQWQMQEALTALNQNLPTNPHVHVLKRDNGWIQLAPLEALPEPTTLRYLKTEVLQQWGMTSLLDMLKETDLRVGFSQHFKSIASREQLDTAVKQRRLLLTLYALGTNMGLKQMSMGEHGESYESLLYLRQRYITKEALHRAIADVANATFAARLPQVWGEETMACASDSRLFPSWSEHLLAEWHARYHQRGVMVYWHVERHATAIFSQLKAPSSSEVAAMMQGVLHHLTHMDVEKNYVDTHGQSEIAFAFCRLLGFELLPRLKRMHVQKLYLAQTEDAATYPNLHRVLKRAIKWDLIRQQYDQMVRYTTALRLGTAEADAILKSLTRGDLQHPTYQALVELGCAVKTIFLCQYLASEALRREIHQGLNVIESWHSANRFIFFGKDAALTASRIADQELSVLALHLLQNSLVYINTLMLQQVLAEPHWLARMTAEDWRGLTPLFYTHVNPYGAFKLDLRRRLPLQDFAA